MIDAIDDRATVDVAPVRTFPALRPLFAYITMRTRGDVGYCSPASLERTLTADIVPWFIALLRPDCVELWARSMDGRLATLVETCEVAR